MLNLEELQALTGYRTRSKIVDWLTRRHWVFEPPDRKGDIPKVARAYFDARMSGQIPTERRIRPNLDWLTKPGAK